MVILKNHTKCKFLSIGAEGGELKDLKCTNLKSLHIAFTLCFYIPR